ncbi:MAG: ASCH domain-containing protein [Pseudomonadota bacterium]
MMFARPLRDRVRSGEITTSVRIWLTPRVKVGGRYPLLDGHIEVTRLQEIDLEHVTEALARESGFESLEALMKTARHGRGERVFLVDFVFVSDSGG